MQLGGGVKQEAIDLYHVSPDKIQIIENCVDTNIFYPLSKKRMNSHYTIIFCGRLEQRKGLNRLLELAHLLEKQDEFFLLIATPDSANVNCFKNMQNTRVEIGHKRNEMNEFYNSGDVMFFPSLYEGMELVTLECLSAGVPVLGRDVGAVGDFWRRGQQGIKLMFDDDMQENLSLMRQLAKQYQEISAKILLHKDMVEKHALLQYKNRLCELVKDW